MKPLTLIIYLALLMPLYSWAATEHDHNTAHTEHDDEEVNHTTIKPAIAEKNGIKVTQAQPGTLNITTKAYGKLAVPPDRLSSVGARFPGLITAVYVNVGDKVSKGDKLAQIESNTSLQRYTLRAPISGYVQHRHANVGEVTDNKPLFKITDWHSLWAEIKIFPAQREQVKVGQPVTVFADNIARESTISHLLPTSNTDAFMMARAPISNQKNDLVPGDIVTADITVAQINVPLVVANRALQKVREQTVVFVKQGNRYESTPVKTGRSDAHNTEILSGLERNATYVVDQSYVIKSEMEKAGVGHHHK